MVREAAVASLPCVEVTRSSLVPPSACQSVWYSVSLYLSYKACVGPCVLVFGGLVPCHARDCLMQEGPEGYSM